MILKVLCVLLNFVIFVHGSCPYMKEALEEGEFFYENALRVRDRLQNDNFVVQGQEPGGTFKVINVFTPEFIEEFQNSSALILAEQYYEQKYLSQQQLTVSEKLKKIESLTNCVPKEKRCKPIPTCDPTQKYRTIDGTCNNLGQPNIGASNTQYGRLLEANFNDGIHETRRNSKTRAPLTSPRTIGNLVYARSNYPTIPSRIINLGAVMFGQFFCHDISSLVNAGAGPRNSFYSCCSADSKVPLPRYLSNIGCEPIDLPSNDPFFSQYQMKCMEFIRGQSIQKTNCQLGTAEKLSIQTSYIDASHIYGYTLERAKELRSFEGGRLISSNNNTVYTVPNCTAECLLLGDQRQVNSAMLLMQTLVYIHFHNFLADQLSSLNQDWNDERLYQEARRTLIAIYEHIAVDDWLKLILGDEYYDNNFGCGNREGPCGYYDETISGTALNEFSISALRYFHSLIPDNVYFYSNATSWYSEHPVSDLILNMNIVSSDFLGIVRGTLYQDANLDGFSDQMRNHVFKNKAGIGIDISSVDIARGRDFGLQPYYQYVQHCLPNGKKIKNWNDLKQTMASDDIEALKQVYDDVHDVDLSAGIYLERKNGDYLGAVGKCIIGTQFHRSIHGDRFFYRLKNTANPFTEEQLQTINSVTYAQILCQVSGVEEVPENAFLVLSETNQLVSCDDVPEVDLTAWMV